jgi:hypothetical protein
MQMLTHEQVQARIAVEPNFVDDAYQAAMDEWIDELARLWDAIGKPLDADRLQIYQRELNVVPLGLLKKVISRVIRENTYSNVPPVGVLWAAVRAELGQPVDVMQALADWCYMQYQPCTFQHAPIAVETEMV